MTERRRRIADFGRALVDIDEGVVLRLERDGLGGAGREAHIEKERLGFARLPRSLKPHDRHHYHLSANAMGQYGAQNAYTRDVLIARLRHLSHRQHEYPKNAA